MTSPNSMRFSFGFMAYQPNPFYTYILNIYDLVLFGFMVYQSGPGSNGNEGVFYIPKAPGLGPHHQIV